MNTLILDDNQDSPVDIYQKLSHDRILFLVNELTDKLATDLVAHLFLKDSEDPDKKITIFINSEGGDIRNVFMLYDAMQLISAPIETICIGSAIDEVVLILAAGKTRFATKNSIIGVSQLMHNGMMYGDLTDAKITMDQYLLDNSKFIKALAQHTGKKSTKISKDFERRVFFSAEESVEYNIIDKVISNERK